MSEPNKYRKKPVEIEAMRFDIGNQADVMEWIGEAYSSSVLHPPEERTVSIETLEGVVTASIGDYIIKGVAGEFYPCRGDIFEQTYEAA